MRHLAPPAPGGRKSPQFQLVWMCFSLGSQILFLSLAPLYPPVPLWQCGVKLWVPLDHLSAWSFLPECKLPTINFIIALYGVACFVFQSQSSILVQMILFNISASQHVTLFSSQHWLLSEIIHLLVYCLFPTAASWECVSILFTEYCQNPDWWKFVQWISELVLERKSFSWALIWSKANG